MFEPNASSNRLWLYHDVKRKIERKFTELEKQLTQVRKCMGMRNRKSKQSVKEKREQKI